MSLAPSGIHFDWWPHSLDEEPTARHNPSDGHDMRSGPSLMSPIVVELHDEAPPVGSVDVRICPVPSTITHSEIDGQETLRDPTTALTPGTVVTFHAEAPPVGLVEVTISPRPTPFDAAATHRVIDGHATSSSVTSLRNEAVQADAPPVGLFVVKRFLLASKLDQTEPKPTHSPLDGQVIPLRGGKAPLNPVAFVTVHVPGSLLGCVEVRMLPAESTATHRLIEGQDTACRALLPSTSTGAAQLSVVACAVTVPTRNAPAPRMMPRSVWNLTRPSRAPLSHISKSPCRYWYWYVSLARPDLTQLPRLLARVQGAPIYTWFASVQSVNLQWPIRW